MPRINLSVISFPLIISPFTRISSLSLKTLISMSVYWVRYNGRKNHNTREAFATKVTSTREISFYLKNSAPFVSWILIKQICISFRVKDVLYRRFEHPPNSLRERVCFLFHTENKLYLLKLVLELRLTNASRSIGTIIFFRRKSKTWQLIFFLVV